MIDVLYHCDASPTVGLGHLARGLQVTRALVARGLSAALAGRHEGGAGAYREARRDARVSYVPSGEQSRVRVAVLDSMHDPERPEVLDEALCTDLASRAESLVVVAGVLDRMEVPPPVDLVVNHLPGLVVTGSGRARVIADFAYAPASAEFAGERPERLGEEIVLVLGAGPAEGPARLLDALAEAQVPGPATLVVSPHLPPAEVRALRNRGARAGVRVVQNVPSLLPLFRGAGAVVTTYGHATYEALTFHLPTFVASHKEFQARYARALAERGLVEDLGLLRESTPAAALRLVDVGLRARLRAAATSTFRESGIERLADLLAAEARG